MLRIFRSPAGVEGQRMNGEWVSGFEEGRRGLFVHAPVSVGCEKPGVIRDDRSGERWIEVPDFLDVIGVGESGGLDRIGQVARGQSAGRAIGEERRAESVAALLRHDVDADASGTRLRRNGTE